MSYMAGAPEQLEHPLLLRSLGVPCWVVTKIFGRKAHESHRRMGEVCEAATAIEFRERMTALWAWCEQSTWPKAVLPTVAKLCSRESEYAVKHSHYGCQRAWNLVDRTNTSA